MLKKELRRVYGAKRKSLTDEEVRDFTGRMLDLFSTVDLQGVRCILSYYPMPERKEFDVSLCEQLLALENERLLVALPKMEDDFVTMNAYLKTKDVRLVKNKFNIMEPDASDLIGPELVDAVFVPLLAFDECGFRGGY